MKTTSTLKNILAKLESNSDVDAVFLTGSYALKNSDLSSDIDLVIIFKENKNNLRSLYEWIDGVFADIFFFDVADLNRISNSKSLDWNSMDGILVTWIQKSEIQLDHSGVLTSLKKKMLGTEQIGVTETEKRNHWQKINYNYVANKRYFQSKNLLYHEALELRLLYSTIDVICAFLALRDIPWRGEKKAISYIKNNEPKFYEEFGKYCKASLLNERFEHYNSMVLMTFTEKFRQWTEDDQIVIKKDQSVADRDDNMTQYIDSIL